VTYALATLAAVAFAFGTVLQQRGNLDTASGENDPRFLVEVVQKPIWLLGLLCQIAGWILQAVALDRGPLIVVQCLTVTSLVIALPLGIWLTDQRIGGREWLGALMVLAGLMIFLWGGAPSGGTAHPASSTWWAACLGTLVLVAILALSGVRLTGARKALIWGSAAGFAFGLQATVTKLFVGEVGHGVLRLLTEWPVYVLILSAIIGFVLTQGALKTGVLAPAMASSNAITLFSSVVLGITVYGEKLSGTETHHQVWAALGLALALAGVGLLGGSEAPAPSGATGRTPELKPTS
jgi:drug/metabolite transporter (DMT)-like permease